MVKDAEKFADEDKKRRAKAEARNQADSLIHSTEKQLAEHGDKVDASTKGSIETAVAALKSVLDSDDVDDINAKTQALAQEAMKLGEAIYKAEQSAASGEGDAQASTSSADEDVVDAEFSEVDEDKKA
jgi:molecular chaperone DnaK